MRDRLYVSLFKNVSSSQKEDSTSSSPTPSVRVQGDENKNDEFPPLPKCSIPLSAGVSSLPKSSLTEPKMEKGTVTLEYKISNTGGDVCHGTWSGDVVSFIRYDTIEKAQMSQSLLQRLRTAEFVNPLVVISSKPNVWLAVTKIDSTLDQFKKKNTGIWSCDDLLDDKYKIIVRDIIVGAIQLVNQGYMGELKIRDIAIINGRAKLMRISNELGVSKLRDQLQNIVKDLLGNDSNNKELIDFYSHMKTMPMCKLLYLINHPILLTSQERLDFIVSSLRLLKYEKKSSNWKNKYDAQYRDEEDKKARRLKEPEYKVVNVNKSDPNSEVNYIATKVEKYEEYKKVYNYDYEKGSDPNTGSQKKKVAQILHLKKKKGYPNTASSQITFSRNVIIHINDDGQYKTSEEVGKQLKIFFPDLWTRLFSLMISEGIDVWDQSNEKYGGDLLSQWRATLKLCILDNDDFATQPFFKICRSFLSFIDMKADKSVAISSLVTTIKKQIITVESKFLQDQFKYRKLEEMLKDDNVSGTSTKCIKFLMRFLKFIALFLPKYALNADGDVKGMFETAYSSLLEDDPDLKKKRKEEILKKHRNLLESVHSNEEFKSLLGNPKNIKDCGISVAESLTILTDRWDKLSNEMNANKKQGARGGIVAATSAVAVTETTARAREAGVVAASSGDSMVAATGVGDSMVAASSGDSMVATTSSGDSTVSDGTNSQHVVVPTVEKAIQRVQYRKKKKNKEIKGKT